MSPLQLVFEEILPDDTETFEEFYTVFAELFPFDDEREPRAAFWQVVGFNRDPDIQSRFGPWREVVAAVRLGPGGPVVGGHVFGATTSQAHIDFGCKASIQGIYLFLAPKHRGSSAFISAARDYAERLALSTFGYEKDPKKPPLIFLEVNNPLHMTEEQIFSDTKMSGLSPYKRYNKYKRLKCRPLDFKYVQLPLGPKANAVSYLDLFCSADWATGIPSELIFTHLRAFTSISILKGNPAEDHPAFAAMQKALVPGKVINFICERDLEQERIRNGPPTR